MQKTVIFVLESEVKQMNISIYEKIDYKKTKIEVAKVMENYKLILLKISDDEKPIISNKYSLKFNIKKSKLSQNEKYMIKVIEVINKLEADERKYIYLKHLSENKMSDEIIFSQCHMYDRGYKAMKKRAYIKMAYMLEIEIYKERI